MTPGDIGRTTADVPAGDILRGVPVGVAVYVIASIAFGVVETQDDPSRLSVWLLANTANWALCGLALWARRHLKTATQAKVFMVLLILSMAAVMIGYTVLQAGSWRMLTSGLILLLAGLSLLIPLGVTAQAITAGGVVAIFLAPLAAGVQPDTALDLPLVALASAAGVSMVGAFVTQRSQQRATAAREAARSEADVATTLIDIGRELNATLSRAEVLHRLADRAAQVFGAPIGAINLIEAAHRLRIVAVCGLPDEQARAALDMYVDLDSIPGAWELLALPLLELPDVRKQDRVPPELLRQFGYSGLLLAPIRRGDRVLGAVTFMYRDSRPPFSARERQLARGLAEQAASALENARLYEEQQEAAEIATALLKVAETLGGSLDPRQVAYDLALLARDLLQCDRSAVYRWDQGRWRLAALHPAEHGPDLQANRAAEFEDARFPFFRELRRHGVLEITNGTSEWVPHALLQQWGVRSSLTALLARGADPLAMVAAVHTSRSGPFSARERRILTGLAQLGVVALTNAQLADQLRGANRVKSEFVATMSHELRTPLNAILGYADLLRDETLGPLQPEQADALDRLRERSLDLLQLIQATLDLNRLEAGVATIDESDIRVGDFIESVRAQIPERWMKPGVRLELATAIADVRLRTDSGKLHAVVRNLIHNALKFTAAGAVQVSIRPAEQPETVLIEVRDTGCGIPADKRTDIFDMFVQAGSARGHDGVGLGLYLCRRYVTLLGGRIDVESQVGQGSTFRIRLPVHGLPRPAATA